MRDTLKYAQMLKATYNTGVHACGIIIGKYDISDVVPVSTAKDKDTGEEMLVTQYEGSVIEDTGLIKMDFLGLKTLSKSYQRSHRECSLTTENVLTSTRST